MPEYLSPGVYVEEISTGPRPIAGVATSIAGMVGVTARGPESGKPRLVTSMLDFHRLFGGFLTPPDKAGTDAADDRGIRWWMLPLAVKGFFDNGGQKLFIKRVVPALADAQAAAWALKPAADQKPAPGATDFELLVEATQPGAGGNDLRFDVRAVEAGRFPLVVADPPDPAPDAPPPDPAKVVVAQKGGLKTGVWVVLIRATGVGDPTFHLLADDGSPAAQGGFEFTLAPAAPAPAVAKGDTLVQVDFEAAVAGGVRRGAARHGDLPRREPQGPCRRGRGPLELRHGDHRGSGEAQGGGAGRPSAGEALQTVHRPHPDQGLRRGERTHRRRLRRAGRRQRPTYRHPGAGGHRRGCDVRRARRVERHGAGRPADAPSSARPRL